MMFINSNVPWQELCKTCSLTLDNMKHNSSIFLNPASFVFMSSNPSLTTEIIQAYPAAPWDWSEINLNPAVTLEMIQALEDRPWSFVLLSANESSDLPRIIAHFPEKNWNRDLLRLTYNYQATRQTKFFA